MLAGGGAHTTRTNGEDKFKADRTTLNLRVSDDDGWHDDRGEQIEGEKAQGERFGVFGVITSVWTMTGPLQYTDKVKTVYFLHFCTPTCLSFVLVMAFNSLNDDDFLVSAPLLNPMASPAVDYALMICHCWPSNRNAGPFDTLRDPYGP